MAGREERYLEDIAKELHQLNRVLERIAQAPIFKKEKEESLDIPQKKQSI